jgi:enterochelin esterase-like enzyme
MQRVWPAILLMLIFASQTDAQRDPPRPWTASPATKDDDGFLEHTLESPSQRGVTKVRVLLPPDLDPSKLYPVIYVLPVEAGDESRYGNGLLEVKQQALHRRHAAIFVAPTFADLPWYADHPTRPDMRQETYFMEVIVPFVEQTYPAIRNADGRLLLGFSKSGWGAWSLLLRHPDHFGRAAAWDAPLMLDQPGKYGSGPIFGTGDNFETYRVSRLVREAKLIDSRRLILLGSGNFQSEHEQIRRLMSEAEIPHTYREGQQRKHDWHSGWVEEAVKLLLASDGDAEADQD